MSFIDKRYFKDVQYKRGYGADAEQITKREPDLAPIIRDGIIFFVLLILVLVLHPFHTVPTGHRGVITQFGKINGIVDEGLAILPPYQKLNIFNVRSETATVENAEGSTSDTQPVKVSLTVRYSIVPNQIAMVFEQFSKDGNLDSYVQTAVQEVFKAVTAKYSAPDLIAKRSQVSSEIYSALGVKLKQYGAQVLNIDMRNFAFSESYMKAINEKTTQEQLKLAADNKVKTIEAEQKAKVAVAEAEASALRAQADGEAYAKTTSAKAEAESLRIQNAALAQNKDVLELRRIEIEGIKWSKWNGVLVPNQYYGSAPVQVQQLK